MTAVSLAFDDQPVEQLTQELALREQLAEVATELAQERELNGILQEGVVDLELAMEDAGWARFAAGVTDEFTPQGRRLMAGLCRSMAISNPLIKRGLMVRTAYIWGQGVTVTAKVSEDSDSQDASATDSDSEKKAEQQIEEDLNALIDAFEEDNATTLMAPEAQEELERALGTDGELYLAHFTSPLTGRVRIRTTPIEEITRIIYNPDDREEPWFYVREFDVDDFQIADGQTVTQTQRVKKVHPALGYRPATRIRQLDGAEVLWDAPIKHVTVNRLAGWRHGIPDVYAAIAWARMYRDFLVDWAGLTKSLSKLAWQATGETKSRASQAAAAARARQQPTTLLPGLPQPNQAGGTLATGPGVKFEAVSKSGATIDANSGKPIAGMAAAGLGLPLTMLLADPGISGARATAQTLDRPTILEMGMRRLMWQSVLTEILEYVASAAVEAPKGLLKGTTTIDDWGRKHTQLAGGYEPDFEWSWPPLAELDPVAIVNAIVNADSTGKMPPLTTVRLLLNALGVPNVDEALEDVTDENGDFKAPEQTAGDIAARRFRAGGDPAGYTNGTGSSDPSGPQDPPPGS